MRAARRRPVDLPDTILTVPRVGYRAGVPSPDWLNGAIRTQHVPGRGRVKSAEEVMEILAAYDLTGIVRAENPVHGSDQQSCSTSCLTVTITGHVPTVRLPCHHAGHHVAAAVPA